MSACMSAYVRMAYGLCPIYVCMYACMHACNVMQRTLTVVMVVMLVMAVMVVIVVPMLNIIDTDAEKGFLPGPMSRV